METMEWLLESDPSIRWQVMRDLGDEAESTWSAERTRVATEGWGAELLALQDHDGQWGGGTYFPLFTSTSWTLSLLRDLGLDAQSPEATRAVDLVEANSRWDHQGERFFDGEVEPCINGMAVAIGAYFGKDVSGIVDRLLGEQMADGGWNCEQENGSTRGAFGSTICVLEGLLEYQRAHGGSEVAAARARGEEYLLARGMMRRLSTGEVPEQAWLRFAYPNRYEYDVLRGLDHLRSSGSAPDPRIDEAVELVASKRGTDGRWAVENPDEGEFNLRFQDDDSASPWNTLRAMRVLRWAGVD